jgi:hypothetical protein
MLCAAWLRARLRPLLSRTHQPIGGPGSAVRWAAVSAAESGDESMRRLPRCCDREEPSSQPEGERG